MINDPLDALNAIWDAAITQGDQVKTQIGSTVSSFRGSTDSIKKNIVDNLAMAQRDYKPLTTQYDGYRYSVSGLRGVLVLRGEGGVSWRSPAAHKALTAVLAEWFMAYKQARMASLH